MPLVRLLEDRIYEIRTGLPDRNARTLFFVHEDVIVLLHCFIKKTRQTPADDLALAKKRKRDYLTAHEQEEPPRGK